MRPAAFLCFLPMVVCSPVASAADQAGSGGKSGRPNIIFILADDLGYTDLSCYGSRYYESPGIDRLAAQGIRFTSGYTCGPNCQPTRAALMSGQYGPRTGVYTVGDINRFNWQSRSLRPVDNVTRLPLEKVTFAQALKSAGYATALFGKWHLGEDGPYHPKQRGFDEAIVSMGVHFDFKTNPPTPYEKGTYLADFLTDKAADFVRRHREGPFLLCLHHFAVHSPHQAKEKLIEHFKPKSPAGGHHNPTYAAMIASVDESVGRIVALLDELKIAENTLVIFTSDNGGVGGYVREGIKEAGDVTDNAPLRGGKGMLYEGGIRVPYIFRWPGHIEPGTTCDEPINSVDLYPTLLEVARARPPADTILDGVSYLSLLTSGGRDKLDRDAIYWHFPGYLGAGGGHSRTTPAGAIRSGDWKLQEFFEALDTPPASPGSHRDPSAAGGRGVSREDGRIELYNLRDDIGEKTNLASTMPDRVKELHGKLAAWREKVGAKMPTPNRPGEEKADQGRERRNARRANRAAPAK